MKLLVVIMWMAIPMPLVILVVKDYLEKRRSRLKNEKTYTGESMSHIPPYIQEFYRCRDAGDIDGMRIALEKNAETCSSRNSYCLTEVFCPECPLANGGLVVQSARKDW